MLKVFEVGPLEANCYILSSDRTGEAAVIDPGGAPKELFRHIENHGLKPLFVINTHGHLDHTGGCNAFKDKFNIPILVHKGDADMLINPKKYVPFLMALMPDIPHPDRYLEDGEILKVGEHELKILHTPGHTKGSVCVYVKDIGSVFTGDTLFFEGVGRTDLSGGSTEDLIRSIRDKLFVLDDATVVYPGHGPKTSIGYEKGNNPFVVVPEEDDD